jgi:hypothetical protein
MFYKTAISLLVLMAVLAMFISPVADLVSQKLCSLQQDLWSVGRRGCADALVLRERYGHHFGS